MWFRIAALLVSMLVMRRAESSALKELSSGQTDDLLQRLSSDREMPKWARLLVKAPWLYRQSPIDLIPDAIPFIGRIDDDVITSFSLSTIARLSPRHSLSGTCMPYVLWSRSRKGQSGAGSPASFRPGCRLR